MSKEINSENSALDTQSRDNSTEFEDVFSSSTPVKPMEDIYSSHYLSKKANYRKKPHGFFSKIAAWWKNCKSWKKASMITATALLLVIAIAFGAVKIIFNYNYNSITKDSDKLGFEDVIDDKIINIALFGIDTRNESSFKGNTDTIMILSLNTMTHEVKIISLMRDTLVPIPMDSGTKYGKINSAYSRGGPELAIKTINSNFGLDISEYATVNFFGMADIIDAVGGIEVELTSAEVSSAAYNSKALNGCIQEVCKQMGISPNEYYVTTSGVHTLNGIQAVAYSRIRYVANVWGTNNDYGRTDRQRYVMNQLFNKATTLKKSQYLDLIQSLIPCCETSLSYTEIFNLAVSIFLQDSPTFSQARLPDSSYLMSAPSGYGSVIYYDLDFGKNLVHAFIYDGISFEDYVAQNGVTKNDWYYETFGNHGYVNNDNDDDDTDNDDDYDDDYVDTSSEETSDITSSDDISSDEVSSSDSSDLSSDMQSDLTSDIVDSSDDSSTDTSSDISSSDEMVSSDEPTSSEDLPSSSEDITSSEVISSETSTETSEQRPGNDFFPFFPHRN